MTGYAVSRDYVGNLQSPWWTPHISTYSTEKQDSDPLIADPDPLVASSVHRTPTQNNPAYSVICQDVHNTHVELFTKYCVYKRNLYICFSLDFLSAIKFYEFIFFILNQNSRNFEMYRTVLDKYTGY